MKIYNRTGIFNGLNKKIIALALTLMAAGLLFMPSLSYAAVGAACPPACATTEVCVGGFCALKGAGIPTSNPGGIFADVDFLKVVTNVANLIISFIAILGIIFLVYGGLQYVTSAGDESKSEDAKRTITYAMIGLFLAASAYAIEKLILVTLMAP
ncbi:hypothetical protein KKB43_01880 [Patescibacteria group bacterium]|nr:hypothetical protein [Patescibacteria group bacterium]